MPFSMGIPSVQEPADKIYTLIDLWKKSRPTVAIFLCLHQRTQLAYFFYSMQFATYEGVQIGSWIYTMRTFYYRFRAGEERTKNNTGTVGGSP